MSGPYNPNLFPTHDLQTTQYQYVSQIVYEYNKISPILQSLPICNRLLNQEFSRVSGQSVNQVLGEHEILNDMSFFSNGQNPMANSNDMSFFSQQNLSRPSGMLPPNPIPVNVKKGLRLYIPVNDDQNNQFIRSIGGSNNTIVKRLEELTDCRIRVNGTGSLNNPYMEDRLRDKPGFEHLNEPCNISIEADLPTDIIDLQIRRAYNMLQEMAKPMQLQVGSFYNPSPSCDVPMIEYTNLYQIGP
ncbi:KH domain-containing protein At2g38610-like [Impatiens glandulifera]|uniref:KH domain-containing protein At2g38610-like n=1 Tax=Impatiens glandulifera TaxID=253017 RepID=UPI001FB1446D|nr:KH domain-containing protein At2g38610-like [Impatiens glandulifera]